MAYMSHRTAWLIAIVAGLVAVVLAVVLILTLWALGSNTHTATNTSARMPQTPQQSPPAPPVARQPGPHSPLADVDLPAGVVFAGNSSNQERWRYTAPYDDTVAFLRKQFATGRKYDTQGATWWQDLPPCYNDKFDANTTPRHESPPGGWVMEDSTLWLWTDGSIALSVEVFSPSSADTPNEIVINYTQWNRAFICNRG